MVPTYFIPILYSSRGIIQIENMCAQGWWIATAAALPQQAALTLDNRGMNRTPSSLELGKDLSMHMFEVNEEHKVILQSIKDFFQESLKNQIVFT